MKYWNKLSPEEKLIWNSRMKGTWTRTTTTYAGDQAQVQGFSTKQEAEEYRDFAGSFSEPIIALLKRDEYAYGVVERDIRLVKTVANLLNNAPVERKKFLKDILRTTI